MPETAPTHIAEVAVFLLPPLGGVYDYLIPESLTPIIGQRVVVPFGKRTLKGVVINLKSTSDFEGELRPIEALEQQDPSLPKALCQLVKWMTQYYHCKAHQSWRLIYPTMVLNAPELRWVEVREKITALGLEHINALQKKAPLQYKLLSVLKNGNQTRLELLAQKFTTTTLTTLIKKGYVQSETLALPERPTPKLALPEINAEQQRVVNTMQAPVCPLITLLEGVTGSGKTRVYQHLAARSIQSGKQCLLLIPEIGLSQQNVDTFRQVFGHQVWLYHSGLSDDERLKTWKAALNGQKGIFIGTRSALFLPLVNVDLYIMDEEHDHAYEQLTQPYYNARNLLLMLAQFSQTKVLLGTATPSLDCLKYATEKSYQHLSLSQRASFASPPKISLIDLRGAQLKGGISPALSAEMTVHLQAGKQVMLFLNRRGYAPIRICRECGHIELCPQCERAPTYHKKTNQLRCHPCQWQKPAPVQCSKCDHTELKAIGHGTERVAQVLRQQFPEYQVAQIDRDSIKSSKMLNTELEKIQSNEYQILIGTTMLGKGHNLPHLSLVGILDADQGLMSNEYRAHEQILQQLEQVSGRSGRNQQGTVLIQTHQPNHELIQTWLKQGYKGASRILLKQRQHTQLPPYLHLAAIRCEAKESEKAQQFLQSLKQALPNLEHLFISDAMPAAIERMAGRSRWLVLIESAQRSRIQYVLACADQLLQQRQPFPRNLRCTIHLDPISLN